MSPEIFAHFTRWLAGPRLQVVHRDQDPPLRRLEAVAGVGQSAADDHAHRVAEVARAQLVLDVERLDPLGRNLASAAGDFLGRQSVIDIAVAIVGQDCLSQYSRWLRVGSASERQKSDPVARSGRRAPIFVAGGRMESQFPTAQRGQKRRPCQGRIIGIRRAHPQRSGDDVFHSVWRMQSTP